MVNKKLKWKFKLNNVTEEEILEYENKYSITVPELLKEIIIEYNGCTVEPNRFDIKDVKGKVLASFMSFSKKDSENVFIFTEILKKNNFELFIPFAMDPFGNYLCIKENDVLFISNDFSYQETICNSFELFINNLY